MVLKIFKTLGIPVQAVDVLAVHRLTKKDSSVVSDRQRPSADGSLLPFIVTLKSLNIRDHIISKKRQKKNLSINRILAVDQTGSIFRR